MTSEKMCCVPNCDSRQEILHKFPNPNEDPDRFQNWIYNIGGDVLGLENGKIFKRRRVCHLHFESKFYTRSKMLSPNAVPTLHLSGMHKVLHGFPNLEKDKKRFNLWLYAIGGDILGLEDERIYKYRRVCHSHFEERYLCRNNKISNVAVPSLHMQESKLPSISDHTSYTREEHNDHNYGKSPKNTLSEVLPGPSRPKTSDEAPQTIATSDKPVVPTVKKNSQTHLHFIKDKKSSGVIQYFSKAENKYDLTEQSFPDSNTTPKIDNDAEDSCAIDNDDEAMHMKGSYVDDLKLNNLNLKLPQVLDTDDNWGRLKLDYYKSGAIVPVTYNSDEETLKEISKSGEIVPKIKKVDDDVWVVGGDDHNDAVMDMEAVTPLDPEHFDDDGDEEHNVPQEHKGFRCNVCLGMIVGFRYRCCECEDYDMCSDCESRGEHPLHYVLRVPGYRKQCEVRRVMAAVHLALALPTDVKDELTIKIEDPWEEQPLDPLHTEEAAPTDLEPMGNENTPTPLTSTDLAPPPAKVPRIEPRKRNEVTLKLVRTNKTDIPVALDALKRRAIVRLDKLKSPLQVNPAQIRSLHEVTPRKHTTDTYSTSVTEKKSIEKALENTRDSSQSRLQNIDHNIPTTIVSKHQQKQHSSTQNVQSKSNLKTIDLLQFAGESQEVMVLPQNITMNSENIHVVERNDDVIVETNAEQVFYMTQEEFNALISAGTLNDNIFVQECPSDETLVLHPPTKSKAICDKYS